MAFLADNQLVGRLFTALRPVFIFGKLEPTRARDKNQVELSFFNFGFIFGLAGPLQKDKFSLLKNFPSENIANPSD